MPYFDTAQEWLIQSGKLIQARPNTTRITTKYHLSAPPDPSKPAEKPRKNKSASSSAAPASIAPAEEPIRATLILKTYDPASGVTLKYETNKGQEVGRLIQILGKLARPMTGLGGENEDEVGDAGAGAEPEVKSEKMDGVEGTSMTASGAEKSKAGAQGQGQGQGGGGKKGKKKGKK